MLQSTPDFTIVKIRDGVEAELPHFDQRRYENERNERPMGERYLHNQHIKAVIIDVRDPNSNLQPVRGEHSRPPIVISRTHPELMRRLFEQEVPEIYEGTVQIKSIAREPGQRSKVAVHSLDDRLDPVGACVGPKGSRVRAVVGELRGERVDVILWDADPAVYVANALSPAKVTRVLIDEEKAYAGVIVPDDQLSLAIGKEGQNARLAARLTGWHIDIKSETLAADILKNVPVHEEPAADLIGDEEDDDVRRCEYVYEYGIIPEEWGGQNMFVNISAKQKIGIDDLLETVLLQADVLELKANPETFASGNVLEAKLDKGRGSVATVLVTRGTLHVGDTLVAGLTYGRVRAMLDPKGNAVTEAGPSDAVEILGLQSVPNAGDEFRVFEDEREARALADERSLKARIEEQSRVKHVTLENLFETIADAEVKELNLIIKADVQGSIEALQDSLDKMDQSEVRINTIHSAVGAINETDVVLADASNAIIIGFGVRPDGKARSAAEREGVEIRCYDVIYKCLEELDAARIGMLKPTEVEVSTGTATVLDTFKVPKVGIAAGVRVEEGEIAATDSVRLVRDGIVVFNGKIASMRHYKDEAKSLKSGSEGGIGLENFQDIKPGDQIEGYRIDQVARTE